MPVSDHLHGTEMFPSAYSNPPPVAVLCHSNPAIGAQEQNLTPPSASLLREELKGAVRLKLQDFLLWNCTLQPFLRLIRLICVATASHMLLFWNIFIAESLNFLSKHFFLTYLPKVIRSQLLRGKEKKMKTKSFCVNSVPGLMCFQNTI